MFFYSISYSLKRCINPQLLTKPPNQPIRLQHIAIALPQLYRYSRQINLLLLKPIHITRNALRGLGAKKQNYSRGLGTGDWGHNDRSVHRWGLGYKSDCV
ncbi:MAG: hypothetical protein HEQ35_16045 [Gloeotrichia echinulata IR180]